VTAVAVPVRIVQQAIMAQSWPWGNDAPPRAYAQVISLPGATQEPYQWDAGTGTLTAMFDTPIGP
jgi:hypothetical protein